MPELPTPGSTMLWRTMSAEPVCSPDTAALSPAPLAVAHAAHLAGRNEAALPVVDAAAIAAADAVDEREAAKAALPRVDAAAVETGQCYLKASMRYGDFCLPWCAVTRHGAAQAGSQLTSNLRIKPTETTCTAWRFQRPR
jgi:hypothetical protein